MKLRLFLAAIAALCCTTHFAAGEEKVGPIIAGISSTTISGYISTAAWWQPHVCRPVLPVRVERVVQVSTSGLLVEIGRNVRCRHGVVFVPNATNHRYFPTPNRSSAFGLFVQRRTIPKRPGRPPLPPSLPPLPPPAVQTNWPPIIVRPPHQGTNIPPVVIVRPDSGSVLMEANRLPNSQPNGPRVFSPFPPTRLQPGYGSEMQRSVILGEERFRVYEGPMPPEFRARLEQEIEQRSLPDVNLSNERRRLDSVPPGHFERRLR
jgi:hypothetical protein